MDRKRQLIFIISVAVVAAGVYAAVRFFSQTEETRIQRAVYAAVAGVEQGDARRYGRILSCFYQDDAGRNKMVLLKTAEEIFRDFRPLRVEVKHLTITLGEEEKDTAVALIDFKCYFKHLEDGKLYYEAGRFEADFRKEGRAWRIRSLRYIDADEIMFIQVVA